MLFSTKGMGVKDISHFSLWLWLFPIILTINICHSEKIRYATDKDCDRHSLDALYYEKYHLITNNIFADCKEFVSRVSDLVADSLTTVMAQLPDRDVSDNEERKVHTQFKNIKSAFSSKVKKMHKNITSSWEDLIASNFDLLFDNGKSSLEDYMSKTIRMTESYSEARKMLDSTLSSFIDFIKSTVRDGLLGIKAASEEAVKKEEKEKERNKTEETTQDASHKGKSKDDVLREKMVEITKMIVPGFLQKVTIEVIEKNLDLTKASGVKPESRDSVLDDIQFDMIMVKNRIGAIIQSDIPRDKGSIDLARRSIYTYWADQADEMYKQKIQSKKSTKDSKTGRIYYRNLWKDEEQIVATLLNLLEIYP